MTGAHRAPFSMDTHEGMAVLRGAAIVLFLMVAGVALGFLFVGAVLLAVSRFDEVGAMGVLVIMVLGAMGIVSSAGRES